jgi:hypothetical protein
MLFCGLATNEVLKLVSPSLQLNLLK